jgi:hypothetical protein
MRGSIVLLLTRLLVLIIIAGIAPAVVGAQAEATPGQGKIVGEQIDIDDPARDLFRFEFEADASLPESEPFQPGLGETPTISSEAMMVFISAGPFVLYTPPTMEEGAVVVVSPDGSDIQIQQWEDQTTQGPPLADCPSPCYVPPDRYATIETGGYVFQKENSGCVY